MLLKPQRGKFQATQMSKLIKLHTLNMFRVLYVNFTSIELLKGTLRIQLFPVPLTHNSTFLHSRSTQHHQLKRSRSLSSWCWCHPWTIFKIRDLLSFTGKAGGGEGVRKQQNRKSSHHNLEGAGSAESNWHPLLPFMPPGYPLTCNCFGAWSSRGQSVFFAK